MSPLAPFRHRAFFWLWLGVVIASVGTWAQMVGAQWLFVHDPNAATIVTLVQTASTLPMMLLALPAGSLQRLTGRSAAGLASTSWCSSAHRRLPPRSGDSSPNIRVFGWPSWQPRHWSVSAPSAASCSRCREPALGPHSHGLLGHCNGGPRPGARCWADLPSAMQRHWPALSRAPRLGRESHARDACRQPSHRLRQGRHRRVQGRRRHQPAAPSRAPGVRHTAQIPT